MRESTSLYYPSKRLLRLRILVLELLRDSQKHEALYSIFRNPFQQFIINSSDLYLSLHSLLSFQSLASSPNFYFTFPCKMIYFYIYYKEMDEHKIMKGLETKILQMNTQIQNQKLQNEQLFVQNGRIQKLLAENNKDLQLKSMQLQKLMEANRKLKEENIILQKSLVSSQHHRKSLFDHLFTNNKEPAQSTHLQIRSNLSVKLKKLNDQFVQYNYQEFENIINQRNNEVKTLSKQYSELMKQFMKSSNEYQQKISSLKQQNTILQKAQQMRSQIESKVKKNNANNNDDAWIHNVALEERIQLLFQKLKISYLTIDQLKAQLRKSKKQRQSGLKQTKESDIPQQVQKILQIMNQNKRLQLQMQQSNAKYQKLVIEFPNIVKNEDQILDFITKYKTFSEQQIKIQQKQIRISELSDLNAKLKQQIAKYQKQFYQKVTQSKENIQFYKILIKKLKQFFIIVNPYFETYGFNQLQLTQKQLAYLNNGKQPALQAPLKIDIPQLQSKYSRLRTQFQLKSTQNSKLYKIIESQNKKIKQFQTINSKLAQTLQNNEYPQIRQIQQKEGALQSFIKIQGERNSLKKQIGERDAKIIELMVEIDFLKQKQLEQIEQNKVLLSSEQELNFCRPSVLWINFNKDIGAFVQKLANFESSIQESHQRYESNINTLKSEYDTQIISLRQKISRLEMEKSLRTEAVVQLTQVQNHNQMQEEKSELQLPLYEANSVFQMQDIVVGRETNEQPAKTLSPQSIEEMSKVFASHETNLKNILTAYNNLKLKFETLQKQSKYNVSNDSYERVSRQLQSSVAQIKAIKERLEQSDRNLVALENQLALKSSELQHYKEAKQLQIRNLKKAQDELSNQIKQRREDNLLEKSQFITKTKSKHYFPQQIQYLVALAMQKHQELLAFKKTQQKLKKNEQLKQVQKQAHIEAVQYRESLVYREKEEKEVVELIRNGELLECLQQALAHLEQQG